MSDWRAACECYLPRWSFPEPRYFYCKLSPFTFFIWNLIVRKTSSFWLTSKSIEELRIPESPVKNRPECSRKLLILLFVSEDVFLVVYWRSSGVVFTAVVVYLSADFLNSLRHTFIILPLSYLWPVILYWMVWQCLLRGDRRGESNVTQYLQNALKLKVCWTLHAHGEITNCLE